jgi:hypothetical protein
VKHEAINEFCGNGSSGLGRRVGRVGAGGHRKITVGKPGNADDTHGDGYGGVAYTYDIGKFEVTAGQYRDFLNAVAATDTYELYNPKMDIVAHPSDCGCAIRWDPGLAEYIVDANGDGLEDADWIDRPVNYVSWGDAARFCNWLHNGRPTGAQGLTTTEDGSYFLDGAMSNAELFDVLREPDAGRELVAVRVKSHHPRHGDRRNSRWPKARLMG